MTTSRISNYLYRKHFLGFTRTYNGYFYATPSCPNEPLNHSTVLKWNSLSSKNLKLFQIFQWQLMSIRRINNSRSINMWSISVQLAESNALWMKTEKQGWNHVYKYIWWLKKANWSWKRYLIRNLIPSDKISYYLQVSDNFVAMKKTDALFRILKYANKNWIKLKRKRARDFIHWPKHES